MENNISRIVWSALGSVMMNDDQNDEVEVEQCLC